MKRTVFAALTVVWLLGGLLMLGSVGAADAGGPIFRCYINAAACGAVSFAALLGLDRLSGGERDENRM